jgi:hypothetical protein
MLGEIHYGGRVTDPIDQSLLSALLQVYICPEVNNNKYLCINLKIYRLSVTVTNFQNQVPISSHMSQTCMNISKAIFNSFRS